jgi:uncharacterized membrane protein
MGMAPKPPENTEQAQRIKRKLSIARALVLATYSGLLLMFTLLTLFKAEPNWPLWIVQVVPLLIFAPGLKRGYHRTYSWLCFVVLLYFTWAVTNTLSPLAYWRDYLAVALTVILFSSAMMASRWRQQWWLWENRH